MRVLLAIIIALATAAPAGAFTLPYRHGPVNRGARPTPVRPAAEQHPASPPAAAATPQGAGSTAAALADVEQALLAAVNGARAENGLAALGVDASLETAARAHTQDLLAHDAFTHDFVDATGSTPFGSWIGRFYRGSCAGENLATGSPTLTPDQAVQLWLTSPGHRANLLSTRFTTIGVALQGSNGTWIATTDFGGC
jgi:uncharacterized protein YkwD